MSGEPEFDGATRKTTAAFGSGTTNATRTWSSVPTNRAPRSAPPLAALAPADVTSNNTATKEVGYTQLLTMTA